MKVRLGQVGPLPAGVRQGLARALPRPWRPGERIRAALDPDPFEERVRGQLDGLRLVLALPGPPPGALDLWLTARDLFTPALTHVVGLAPVGGRVGVVSLARLPPPREPGAGGGAVSGPLVVEAAHELGHAAGLVHCVVPRCPMRPALVVEELDLRRPDYCPACLEELTRLLGRSPPASQG